MTDIGRMKLSMGQLNFTYWGIGDSEINYGREIIVDNNQSDVSLSGSSRILRPFDTQPNIKYFITPSTATSNLQLINDSNINVVKAIVNNEAIERGFFTDNLGLINTAFTTTINSTLTPYQQPILNTRLSGTSIITLSATTNYSVGDNLLLKLSNSKVGSIPLTDTIKSTPNLWYRIQDMTGNTIQLDRNLPNLTLDSATSQVIIYRGGEVYNSIATGNTTSYWDSGTLSFNSSVNITCSDIPVWNMNNIWCENLAGLSANTAYQDYTKFGSYQYLGTKNPYFEYLCQNTGNTTNFNCNGPGIAYPDDVSKSISVIHYTNNAISNLYGEFLYVDATNNKYVQVHLPNIMYHRVGYSTQSGQTMGMTFIASGKTEYIGSSEIEYIDLIEYPNYLSTTATTTPLIVGKVFPQLKMIVFDDDEIVAAMSYKSNRNWTLPELSANIVAPSGGTSTGILLPNKTIYLTYSLENTGATGLTSSLPCQKYVKVTNNSSSAKDISFKINKTDVLPYMRKTEKSNYDGYGFYATNFKLLYQIVDDTITRPNPASWNVYDYTSTNITNVTSQTIDPLLLENQNPTGFILDLIKNSTASNFNLVTLLNMPPNNQPNYLQFGDERFFYGNIETYIGATIYKTIFDLTINATQFNSTSNPTRSNNSLTNPPNIKITEVGIYDSSQNLVCIGKLSNPVALTPQATITIEASLDF
jgi:hypothetical protein